MGQQTITQLLTWEISYQLYAATLEGHHSHEHIAVWHICLKEKEKTHKMIIPYTAHHLTNEKGLYEKVFSPCIFLSTLIFPFILLAWKSKPSLKSET